MSASLTAFEQLLLQGIWLSSVYLAALSTALLLFLAIRRIFRNHKRRRLSTRAQSYEKLLSAIVYRRIPPGADFLPPVPPKDITALVGVLLTYLHNFSGPDAKRIVDIIVAWDIEKSLCDEALNSRRGRRIQALALLSYLSSPTSLEAIREALEAGDSYIQLAAIRCLARRNATHILPDIIRSVNNTQQHNGTLLADVLQRFGLDAVDQLQNLVDTANNETVRAAALEALTMLAPHKVSINFDLCLDSEDDAVRAAAVTLAGQTKTGTGTNPLAAGVKDASPIVRARAAVAIRSANRIDMLDTLRGLIDDSAWWVRYCASRSLWGFGAQGRAILRSLASQNNSSGIFAREFIAEVEGQ